MKIVKPANMRWVDMCKYFDEHSSDPDRNDELLFQYLTALCYMLACVNRYFRKYSDYEDFALYAATKIYTSMCVRGIKIKGILNYLKSSLYLLKVRYQQYSFNQIIDKKLNKNVDTLTIKQNIANNIQADYNIGLTEDFLNGLLRLPKILLKVVKNTPFKKDPLIVKRLYKSCLLSFIKSLSFSNSTKDLLSTKENAGILTDKKLINLYRKEREKSIILWHLPNEFYAYVEILLKRATVEIVTELKQLLKLYKLDESDIDAIMATAFVKTSKSDMKYTEE